jgi:hypothetical protein
MAGKEESLANARITLKNYKIRIFVYLVFEKIHTILYNIVII